MRTLFVRPRVARLRLARFRIARALWGPPLVLLAACLTLHGQPPSTVPPEGLRDNTPAVHALVNARVVVAPGKAIDKGTVVIRDGVIVAVGPSGEVEAPADARVWDLSGKTVYAGLIDAYSEMGEASRPTEGSGRRGAPSTGDEMLRPAPPSGAGGAAYWNPRVTPQYRADRQYTPDAAANRILRGQGVVARLVAPSRQIIKGISAAVGTGDGDGSRSILRAVVAMHLQLAPSGGGERGYPNSPMGAVALVRQAMYDAQWYAKAWKAWEADPSLPRPEKNDALEALQPAMTSGEALPVVIDAPDEQYALRADRFAKEFGLKAVLRGSGQEYRRLDLIAATGRPVIVPLNFAKPPNVASPEAAMAYSLEDLMDWDLQPENPARLERAGVKMALTAHGLKDKATFLAAVRKAVARGLSADAALRALTVTPAELLGVGKSHGTIETGKTASLVVTDGELFAEKTKVLETWVDGRRYEIVAMPREDARGTWAVKLGEGEGAKAVTVKLTGEPTKLKGKLTPDKPATRPATQPATGPTTGPSTKPSDVELTNLAFSAMRLSFTFKGERVARELKGIVQVSATVSGEAWLGTGVRPDGTYFTVTATRTAGYSKADDKDDAKEGKDKDGGDDEPATQPTTLPVEAVASAPQQAAPPPGERERPTTGTAVPPKPAGGASGTTTQPANAAVARSGEKASTKPALFDVTYPLGGFGRAGLPDQSAAVLFKDATVWTCGPRGKLEKASVLVERGKISNVLAEGERLNLPEGTVVIDCAGKHIAPGIIDCHSHIATDGGVNEGTQSITCEVRIGDFIDPNDINIYRQLAGGVTAANVLHGSANTIGGQNQVVKMRWGASDDGLKFAEAPPGVKFALGENVKQSNWGERATTRYPQSRMGVEQIVRDAFNAARDYRRSWEEFTRTGKGVPPRVDLELEALWEIVSGSRMIHCHSYRQDEILALIRTCEAFNVKIAVFQHVLEGYKVADAIAKHGAAGSAFSDWWAYKFEVYDAIPYAGSLMHNAGVNVSFNSDDAELARRLNLEAAKAVKYGGVPEEEALKFVTLNPAKQLKVDQYVGSIEPGKHADLVVWSGKPTSTLSRCEQTWVDGRRYFDREEDRKLKQRDAERKNALVQKILTGGDSMAEPTEGERRPRDTWARDDVFCGKCEYGAHLKQR